MITQPTSAAQSSAVSQPAPPHSAMPMPTNAAPEVTASDQWCIASMPSVVLPTASPCRLMRRENQVLVTITPANTSSVHQAGPWCGVLISSTACQATQPAMAKMKSATASPASGSALPWP
jgi:hypothetical protein